MADTPPFGTYAPRGLGALARHASTSLSRPGKAEKALVSGLYRLAGGRNLGRAFDVELFGGARARLYPADNISEKRCFAAPQFWDEQERTALGDAVRTAKDRVSLDAPFVFADIGANAGLYSLSVLSDAARHAVPLRIIAVEPDPAMQSRMDTNLALNDFVHATIYPYAITRTPGPVTLHHHPTNKGQASLDGDGVGVEADGVPLLQLLDEAGVQTVHAMKVDIEGADVPALAGLFEQAPRARWPEVLCVEVCGPGAECPARFCKSHGYSPIVETRRNAVLRRAG